MATMGKLRAPRIIYTLSRLISITSKRGRSYCVHFTGRKTDLERLQTGPRPQSKNMAKLGVMQRLLAVFPTSNVCFLFPSLKENHLFLGGHQRLCFLASLTVNCKYVTKCQPIRGKWKCHRQFFDLSINRAGIHPLTILCCGFLIPGA